MLRHFEGGGVDVGGGRQSTRAAHRCSGYVGCLAAGSDRASPGACAGLWVQQRWVAVLAGPRDADNYSVEALDGRKLARR